MPDRKLNADSDTVDYVLNTYSNYIDNLQIIELNNLLLKDKHHYGERTVRNIISSVLQLIIDECGSDIVNNLEVPHQSIWGYYLDVVFDDHVDIRRDIADNEFAGAKFNNGVTVQSKKLPDGALGSTYMNGIVDLTNVVELGGFNLNYIDDSDCYATVKLSKDLKKIDCFLFATRFRNSNVKVEYPGTVSEFNDIVFENILQWPESSKIRFDTLLGTAPSIRCLDGDWRHSVFKRDQRYNIEWTKLI